MKADIEKRIEDHIKIMKKLSERSRDEPELWTAFEEGILILLEGQLEILSRLEKKAEST